MRRYSTVVKRLKENYKQHKKIISYGLEQRFNEASTTDIVEDVVEKSLGFDRFMDRHAQLAVDERGKEIVDIVLQFSNYQIPIEIKAITSKMTKNHIIQLSAYCKLIGSHYGILTNGVQWRLYHYGEDREEPIPISRLDFEQDSLERVIDQLIFFRKNHLKEDTQPRELNTQQLSMQNISRMPCYRKEFFQQFALRCRRGMVVQ